MKLLQRANPDPIHPNRNPWLVRFEKNRIRRNPSSLWATVGPSRYYFKKQP